MMLLTANYSRVRIAILNPTDVLAMLRTLRRKIGNQYCRDEGICYDAAQEIARMLKMRGEPAEVVVGYFNTNPAWDISKFDPENDKQQLPYAEHAWVELAVNGVPYILDVTAEQFNHWNKALKIPAVIFAPKMKLPFYVERSQIPAHLQDWEHQRVIKNYEKHHGGLIPVRTTVRDKDDPTGFYHIKPPIHPLNKKPGEW
jgi:hypothetical protein